MLMLKNTYVDANISVETSENELLGLPAPEPPPLGQVKSHCNFSLIFKASSSSTRSFSRIFCASSSSSEAVQLAFISSTLIAALVSSSFFIS